MLSRLLVGDKLKLLAIAPLLAIALITVPLVADQVQGARRYSAIAARVQVAAQLGPVLHDLERERLLSLAYLALPDGRTGPLVTQGQSALDEIADARAAMGLRPNPTVAEALAGMDALDAVRRQILRRSITSDLVNAQFSETITNLIDGLDLAGGDGNPVDGAQERALRALLLANERSSNAAAALLAGLGTPDSANATAISIGSALEVERVHVSQFEQLATPSQLDLFSQAEQSVAARQVTDLHSQFRADPQAFVASGPVEARVERVFLAVDSQSGLHRLVHDKIVQDIVAGAARSAHSAIAAATVFGVLSVGLVVAVMALSIVVGRSVSRPLRRLTVAADRVAELASAELVRVSDEDRDQEAAPRLAAVDVRTFDEIGDLAAAINRVQAVAALLLERQVASRRNVAVMFGNIGRRTQNLVGRQLSLIDSLERNEEDPELLHRLYRLDHLTSRLRRNANSLLVLSGAGEQLNTSPLPAVELVRAALGEIEDFQRVDIGEFDDALVRPNAASDVALLLAELLENATSFSPPTTRVQVGAMITPFGCRVLVTDHGIGMSEAQLVEENARLVRRERLDVAPTDVLGLFVVGRLARRHDVRVVLRPTPGGGLTADVLLPPTALVKPPASDRPAAGSPLRAAPAAEAAVRPAGADSSTDSPRRRVRGAQLPDIDRAKRPRWEVGDSPEAAKALVEQFESGVLRAGRHAAVTDRPEPEWPVSEPPDATQTAPLPALINPTPTRQTDARHALTSDGGTHGAHEIADEFRQIAQRALDHLAAVSGQLGASSDTAEAGSGPRWFGSAKDDTGFRWQGQGSAQAGDPDRQPLPPPGAAGLRRRVRGANLPTAVSPALNERVRIGQPDDPDLARGFVLDIEAGIARAAKDISNASGPRRPEEADS